MRKYEFELNENGTVKSAKWDETETTVWRTNGLGEGVFEIDYPKNDMKQYAGTCQFSVYGLKPGSARAKIRKWMQKFHDFYRF